jgi:hypothetical protein
MNTISVTICKTKRPLKLPRSPKLTGREPAMTGRKLIHWLKAQGAKPLDPTTRKRLAAAGHLGLPDESDLCPPSTVLRRQ